MFFLYTLTHIEFHSNAIKNIATNHEHITKQKNPNDNNKIIKNDNNKNQNSDIEKIKNENVQIQEPDHHENKKDDSIILNQVILKSFSTN
jgi:hypothetical protein